jgi:fructokinase
MSDAVPGTVVVIGDALIDEIHDDDDVRDYVGGAALNVAVGLSRLGIRTSLIAMVGDDADGRTIREFLTRHDVTLVATTGPNGSSRGVSDRIDGEPFYVFNAAARARRVEFGPAERDAIAAADLVVVSCFPFDDVEQSDALFESVGDPRSRLVIDPNPRDSMMVSTERFRQTFDRLAPNTLLVKVGDDDAALLYGLTLPEFTDRLLSSGVDTVIATAGRYGAEARTREGIGVLVPIAELPGPIVDTMGGGDATLASLIQTILVDGFPRDAGEWEAALTRAMVIAAATCRSEGALLQLP